MLRALILAVSVLAAAPALAFFPWYPLVDDPNVGSLERIPACETMGPELAARFNEVEQTYWNGRHTIVAVEALHQSGVRPQRDDLIARRWCRGTAIFADGTRRGVTLELASNAGFVGLTYSLVYCIQGLDRHWTYAPNCRVLRQREF